MADTNNNKKNKKSAITPGKFWSTQPVPQSENSSNEVTGEGRPIDSDKDPQKDIKQTPYPLPNGFDWYAIDIDNTEELDAIYTLLRDHYVEDDDNMFRFDYSREFLKWALKPPGFLKEWHLAVRHNGKTFVGFISAIPADIVVCEKEHKMVEINFLCVHAKLRKNRLAPVLIREITRRVNVQGRFQAVYTAGITIPTPISSCQYWHRSLNPKKLIEVEFSFLKKRMTLQRTIKLYDLPEKPQTENLRPLEKADCPTACALLNDYLKKFNLHMHFEVPDFEHWFLPVKGVIQTFVVTKDGKVTDMISYYSLPSSILKNPKHQTLFAAYSWYNVATTQKLDVLMNDSLILAKNDGFDVFNCLEIQDNASFLKELKFGPGDGKLQYYLYNWMVPAMEPGKVGLVLL